MDSNQYYNAVRIKMQEKNYKGSNFTKKVGKELNIFSDPKKKKLYIESKIARILADYEYSEPIKWNSDKKGLVKISKKGVLSFPKGDLENQDRFLSHIPFALSLYFDFISKKQKLCEIGLEHWVDLFSRRFLSLPFYSKISIATEKDTLFVLEIQDSLNSSGVELNQLVFEKNDFGTYAHYKKQKGSFFYMNINKRHLLYRFYF